MRDYYNFYLTLHTHPKCKLLHFLGQLLTIIFVCYMIYNESWVMLFFAPFIVYPFAWIAHGIFEKNKPLAWDGKKDYGWTTLKAKACDWIMFYEILRGKHRIW